MSKSGQNNGSAGAVPKDICPICNLTDGLPMVACDSCDQWYHQACVGVDERIGEPGVEWFCPAHSIKETLNYVTPSRRNISEKHRINLSVASKSSSVSSEKQRQAALALQRVDEEFMYTKKLEEEVCRNREQRAQEEKKARELFEREDLNRRNALFQKYLDKKYKIIATLDNYDEEEIEFVGETVAGINNVKRWIATSEGGPPNRKANVVGKSKSTKSMNDNLWKPLGPPYLAHDNSLPINVNPEDQPSCTFPAAVQHGLVTGTFNDHQAKPNIALQTTVPEDFKAATRGDNFALPNRGLSAVVQHGTFAETYNDCPAQPNRALSAAVQQQWTSDDRAHANRTSSAAILHDLVASAYGDHSSQPIHALPADVQQGLMAATYSHHYAQPNRCLPAAVQHGLVAGTYSDCPAQPNRAFPAAVQHGLIAGNYGEHPSQPSRALPADVHQGLIAATCRDHYSQPNRGLPAAVQYGLAAGTYSDYPAQPNRAFPAAVQHGLIAGNSGEHPSQPSRAWPADVHRDLIAVTYGDHCAQLNRGLPAAVQHDHVAEINNRQFEQRNGNGPIHDKFSGNPLSNLQYSIPTTQQMLARKSMSADLPEFSGCPEEWPFFITSYDMTNDMCGFSHVENLLRLRKCLKGDAFETVRHRLNLPNCVPEIIEELRNTYGRPSLIINNLMSKIRKQPTPKFQNIDSIVRYSNTVRDLCASMESSGITAFLCDPTMLSEITHKLPMELYYPWATYKMNVPVVTLSTFSRWLTIQANALKCDRLPAKQDEEMKPRKNDVKGRGFINAHLNDAPTQTDVTEEIKWSNREPRKCRVCNQETCMTVKDCKIFKSMDVSGRWDVIKKNAICRTCLRYHRGYSCKSYKNCGVDGCTVKHHELLHSKPQCDTGTETTQSLTAGQICTHQLKDPSVLFRIMPVTVYGKSTEIETFAFLDDGSSLTLIEDGLADALCLEGELEPLCLKWTSDTSRTENDSRRVTISIAGTNKDKKYTIGNVHTVKSLSLPAQTIPMDKFSSVYPHLKGLPIASYHEATPRILIGLDNWKLGIPSKVREGGENQPVAAKTRLGWSIFGTLDGNDHTQQLYHHSVRSCDCAQDNDALHQLVKNYFSVESLGVVAPKEVILSVEDARAQNVLETTTVRKGNRFETGLIWKYNSVDFPNNFEMAKRRLECLEKKMARDPDLRRNLNQQICDYVAKGYARKLSNEELKRQHQNVWYLPIFPVINPNKPGKVRLVWDAAAKVNDFSLNSALLKGPDMLASLPCILYRFRERKIGICGDIKEMFHQVLMRESDQHVQRFLWPSGGTDPDVFVMQVMTFGASCSPSSAQYVKNTNALEFLNEYPKAVKAITENHYVDDYLDSMNTEEEAIQLAQDVKFVHQKGGFHIRNWVSNSDKVMEVLNDSSVDKSKDLNMSSEPAAEKVLGMWWCTTNDYFMFKLTRNSKIKEILQGDQSPTKREVLRVLMMIFDPLGLLSHFLVFIKILLQDVWRSKLDWDDQLDDILYEKWLSWVKLLPQIESIRISRCYKLNNDIVELHIFTDASEGAYAAVGYFRAECEGRVTISLVGAKSRVAPLKVLSIPRLELEACLLGSRLAKSICDSHSFNISSCKFWSDSKTALGWIKSDHRRYRQFVAFRVAEVLENTEAKQWRYVPTQQNVADEATKWSKTSNFDQSGRWFLGPDFLYLPTEEWPEDISQNVTTEEEIRPHLHHRAKTPPIVQLDPKDYSTWSLLKWRFANVFRFVHNLKAAREHRDRRTGPVSSADYLDAENYLYRQAQYESYADEIAVLEMNRILEDDKKLSIEKSSPLYRCSPYLDENGVIRTKGRIDAAVKFGTNVKRPVLLPGGNHITRLIIRFYHAKYLHQNSETVINELRQRYIIPRLRVLLKVEIRQCEVCRLRKAVPVPPLMGDLPAARLMSYTRPFSFMGIDYFGPINVTVGRSLVKRWGVLVTCLTTRAIHIEVSHTLSTDSCIMVLRTVMARRGVPNEIYSDNGSNFRGASVELQKVVALIDKIALAKEFTTTTTKWIFIPPASPHMGGSWERLVRSVKTSLAQIMTTRNPNDELLRCMLIEVENVVNSRPLTYVPLDDENSEALTPNHFLIGSSNGLKPVGEMTDEGVLLRQNYMRSNQIADAFWKRWVIEYLPHLTRRTKWFKPAKPIEEGDIVLIVDNNHPRNCWPRGRIIKAISGTDGQVRSVMVQTASGIYQRPAVKIAVLDVESNKWGKSTGVVIPRGSVDDGSASSV